MFEKKYKFRIDEKNIYKTFYEILTDITSDSKKYKNRDNALLSALYYNQTDSFRYLQYEPKKIIEIIELTKNPDIEDKNGVTSIELACRIRNKELYDKIMKFNPKKKCDFPKDR